ncbi:DNA cytosine methyltransferase [Sphingopyxis flava]|uniref:DNA (cytosine-5-)-methyltransferase n=1 Tax=Sphingopyxis flava TaxID=1507287 RepID=A0A1T5ABP2_9SPHN|nr:DNA cytosine methyltransferase [Sphingopyxis flava]SKB32177.1 DNA (cytosine-5)-methyltransferase 1 [Sphingopyxis flava]
MKLPGLFIDGFAGGGGASTGIAQAIGRDPDIAVNHSPTAIAIHKANHPDTDHHCCDIRLPFLPRTATRGRKVWGVWFSPDCKEYSKAKGGPVKDRSIRALCWEVIEWVRETQPECGFLENVEEFQYAAPLDGEGVPIAHLKGREFKRFVRALRGLGFRVQWRILKACDYGAPTSRKRLYMIFRRDGLPIVWPKPTHAPANDKRVLSGKLLPYRTAAECIDWTIPCPSIFERDRELAEATKRRIAHGVMRYVVNAAHPFIVGRAFTNTRASRVFDPQDPLRTATTQPEYGVVDCEIAPHVTKFRGGAVGSDMTEPMPTVTANGVPARPAGATPLGMVDAKLAPIVSHGQHGGRSHRADQPHHTIAASAKDTNQVIGATLVGIGGRRGQSPPMPVDGPYPTTTVKADNAIACATMVKMGNGEREGQDPRALDLGRPYGTVTAKGSQAAAVTAFLSSFYTSNTNGGRGDPLQPLKTACAGGQHHAVVAAHMEQANTGMVGHTPRKPLSTIVGKGCTQRIVETTMIEEGALPPDIMERAVRTAAFLVKYYGTDGENETAQIQPVDRPLDVVTVKARFAVVTVTIDATTYVIVDIGLRMLKPRELARAQGFPDDYVLDPVVRKFVRGKWVEKPLTIAEQISAIGNSVCPPVARALVAANQPDSEDERMAA